MEEKLTEGDGIRSADLRTYSPQTLAFLGDAVYEMLLRERIVRRGSRPAKELQTASSRLARAGAQAAVCELLLPQLTPEEKELVRRGRNAHPGTVAKHASMAEYRRATGLETMIGALYLREQTERIRTLLDCGWDAYDASLKGSGEAEDVSL